MSQRLLENAEKHLKSAEKNVKICKNKKRKTMNCLKWAFGSPSGSLLGIHP
jgi:hypothetical protein